MSYYVIFAIKESVVFTFGVFTILDLLAPSFGDESGASGEVNSANLLLSSLVSYHLVCCETSRFCRKVRCLP